MVLILEISSRTSTRVEESLIWEDEISASSDEWAALTGSIGGKEEDFAIRIFPKVRREGVDNLAGTGRALDLFFVELGPRISIIDAILNKN